MTVLTSNHFKVKVADVADKDLCMYNVHISDLNGRVPSTRIRKCVIKSIERLYYSIKFGSVSFAYDGGKVLYTFGSLPERALELKTDLVDFKFLEEYPLRDQDEGKEYVVKISYVEKVSMQTFSQLLHGQHSSQAAMRVLDIIFRQHVVKSDYFLLRRSFFCNAASNFFDVGGGVLGCRGFRPSFHTTQGGLSLNIDVSSTMIIQPGPVVDFLLANQNVEDPGSIDWAKAKRALKNLRVKTSSTNTEHKINGLSEKTCKELWFLMKHRGVNDENMEPMIEITVYDYFVIIRKIPLTYSGDLPCVDVGTPKRPMYIPLELCSLVPLQRYTNALTTAQQASFLEKSRQKPQDRMITLKNVLGQGDEQGFHLVHSSSAVYLYNQLIQVEGRILPTPSLRVGNDVNIAPEKGNWNFNEKKFVEPTSIERWAVINFSTSYNYDSLLRNLMRCGDQLGMRIDQPVDIYEENLEQSRSSPLLRVSRMLENSKLKNLSFLLCLLPERKNSPLYGPLKRLSLTEYGFTTQCIVPKRIFAPTKASDQYLKNVLLKINAKLGGLNMKLLLEHTRNIPFISKIPTLILGMDVSHGPPGQSHVPSIAAVASSREWPMISKYRVSVRSQAPKVELIDSLFKKVSERDDAGIMREIFNDFCKTSRGRPEHIIIFRDGVSISQFDQVLTNELNQIKEAVKFWDENWYPKFVVIIAQKNHHTKFFLPNCDDNVSPGTVIDSGICDPRNKDFYLCAQAGSIGTTRPTHYHVLLNEVGFSKNDLQEFINALSYVYQRSTTAISVVAPLRYAHLAATQMGKIVWNDIPETTSSYDGGVTAAGPVPVPQLPCLKESVRHSMFFV